MKTPEPATPVPILTCNGCGNTKWFDINIDGYVSVDGTGNPVKARAHMDLKDGEKWRLTCGSCGSEQVTNLCPEMQDLMYANAMEYFARAVVVS